MNTLRIGGAILLFFLASTLAEGSPLYTTTDLGPGFHIQTDGVANSNYSVVYPFDKSPNTPINVQTTPEYPTEYSQVLTLQSGNHQVGYYVEYANGAGLIRIPTFEGGTSGWWSSNSSPVSDMNTSGQVVGTSQTSVNGVTYAAFSTVNGMPEWHELKPPSPFLTSGYEALPSALSSAGTSSFDA